jgi:hypothetical protein
MAQDGLMPLKSEKSKDGVPYFCFVESEMCLSCIDPTRPTLPVLVSGYNPGSAHAPVLLLALDR